ncbi:diguanylate cyclase [Sphingobacterium phlebotomi]|uniref:Diguanylate cyclase n=1 Tax=Sphingobacterium phlebotomi TaxID=2605433 RepID=A0A5D4H8G9_9SPHI|nr:diguanylate cyclase [Sphingobacterium phlebotomi]TYR36543.1 diguanylate cyclase [Sphingobacterium phlebotomi]
MFLWIFILFYVVQLFDLEWSSGDWRNQVCFHENQQTTLLQFLLLLMVNGYFIMLKNNEMQKLYRQALHAVQPSYSDIGVPSIPESPSSVQELVKLAQEDNAAFTVAFRQVFPTFYSSLYRQKPDITPDEFKLCALLKLGFTTKDIANYNHLAVRTVQTKKSRLRKSFGVPPQEDLYTWIAQF